MHIMNAESIHALGRGGKIVSTIFNREGLSLSYPDLRRYQHDLASYTAQVNSKRILLPSHFDLGHFTPGSIDNWDHEGMNVSEHDIVAVLNQDKLPSPMCKPRISDTIVEHGQQAFNKVLPCQQLLDFSKPALPEPFVVSKDINECNVNDMSKLKDKPGLLLG